MAGNQPAKAKVDRDRDELVDEFSTQLRKLDALAALYDQGEDHFAMDIATVLRKLFRHRGNSKSLLGQLDQWDPELFDTTATWTQGEPNVGMAPVSGMAFAGVAQIGDELHEVWQPAFCPPGQARFTKFSEWWRKPLFRDEHNISFTREDLVGWACDQDGGAHVDPRLDRDYFRLTREGSYFLQQSVILGDAVTDPTAPISPDRIILVQRAKTGLLMVRAIIRQIAFEVQSSPLQH